MDSIQEVLITARENLSRAHKRLSFDRMEPDPTVFQFSSWPSCTCGHIYIAAAGAMGTIGQVVGSPGIADPLYLDVIEAAATALGWERNRDWRNAPQYISDITVVAAMARLEKSAVFATKDWQDLGEDESVSTRIVDIEDAIRVVDEALAEIQKAELEAMVKVANASEPKPVEPVLI